MFELTSPYNRVVVPHQESKLTLIGVRDFYGFEVPIEQFAPTYPVVRSFPLQSMEDIAKTFDTMDPVKQEGYVVCDLNFNRVKVKHPGYVAIHHMKDGFGPKRMLALVQSNEGTEFLAHFPEWANAYTTIKGRFDALVAELQAAYDAIGSCDTQKDFALQALKTRCPAALFARRRYGTDFRQFLSDPKHTDTVAQMLDIGSVQLEGGV